MACCFLIEGHWTSSALSMTGLCHHHKTGTRESDSALCFKSHGMEAPQG